MEGLANNEGKKGRKFLSMQNLVHNQKNLTNSRRVVMVFGGCIAGVLGLRSISGLLLFFAMQLLISLTQFLVMEMKLSKYTLSTPLAFVASPMFSEALTFVLGWCLFYALVHIY